MRRNDHASHLLPAIAVGIICGVIVGGWAPDIGTAVQFLGEAFLRALFLMVVPLVMSSIIVGVSSLGDVRALGTLGGRTVAFFAGTTMIAVIVGLVLVLIVRPGETAIMGKSVIEHERNDVNARLDDRPQTLGALLRTIVLGLIPDNVFAAMAKAEVLPLIVFSLVFGGILTTMGERGRVVLMFVEGVNEAIMAMVHLLMWTAPIGIGALLAGRLGEAGGFSGFWPQVMPLSAYVLTVLFALGLHGLIILPLLLRVVARVNSWRYLRAIAPALLTAFSTSSSSATLPLTIERVIDGGGVSRRVAGFVLPLGATINMNGTALYEAIAAVFIAQTYGVEIGLGHAVVIALTATLAAIGAAGIPEAGLVTMVIVLKAVDLPIEGISLILIVDWLLDRCRTAVNVWGDAVGAAAIDRLEGRTGSA
ncbi:MAG: dicarboxylate/amino acid:cation symporter [Nitrospirae bacterium]|nr:MAG: dicarboxylate/amino acid:cation symporter [Nitrospirota bacterium]